MWVFFCQGRATADVGWGLQSTGSQLVESEEPFIVEDHEVVASNYLTKERRETHDPL